MADAGIEADISKGNITEIPVKQNTVDIIFTTSNYTQPTKVPVIKVFGLISGIGKDKIKDEIVAACLEIEKINKFLFNYLRSVSCQNICFFEN